ncbi:hypothetical protein, partial [Eggerthella lenta]
VMSGLAVRAILWVIITSFCIFYTMRYCKKISKNPSLSIIGETEHMAEGEELDLSQKKSLSAKAVLTVLFLILPF